MSSDAQAQDMVERLAVGDKWTQNTGAALVFGEADQTSESSKVITSTPGYAVNILLPTGSKGTITDLSEDATIDEVKLRVQDQWGILAEWQRFLDLRGPATRGR